MSEKDDLITGGAQETSSAAETAEATSSVVVNDAEWHDLCAGLQLDPEDPATLVSRDAQRAVIRRIRAATKTFPQYGVPRAVGILRTPWTVENELLTSTMKLKRRTICERFSTLIDQMYAEINA